MSATPMIPSAMRLRIAANNLAVKPAEVRHQLAAALAIGDRCTSLADQRQLTEMLGLDSDPVAGLLAELAAPGPQVAPMLAAGPPRATSGRRHR